MFVANQHLQLVGGVPFGVLDHGPMTGQVGLDAADFDDPNAE